MLENNWRICNTNHLLIDKTIGKQLGNRRWLWWWVCKLITMIDVNSDQMTFKKFHHWFFQVILISRIPFASFMIRPFSKILAALMTHMTLGRPGWPLGDPEWPLGCPGWSWVIQGYHWLTKGDPWVTQDDPWVTQDDPGWP